MKLVERQCRTERGRQVTHGPNRRRIGVHPPHIEAVSQEIRKIAPTATAGVEHTAATVESAAKELIEKIDVDLAEFHAQFGGGGKHIGGHQSLVRAQDFHRVEP